MRKASPTFIRLLPVALLTGTFLSLLVFSCKKYEDKVGPSDPRLSRLYCNDPEAVNFNWDFPGTPDNSVCLYPADAFKGQYRFTDSIYNSASQLVLQRQYTLDLYALSRSRLALLGFCGPSDTVKLTASRFFRATVDTTVLKGQALCRPQDTLSGYLTRTAPDAQHLHFFFTVTTDTGFTFHMGTAVKQ